MYLKDPKLWELWYIFLTMGTAGFISSALRDLEGFGLRCAVSGFFSLQGSFPDSGPFKVLWSL